MTEVADMCKQRGGEKLLFLVLTAVLMDQQIKNNIYRETPSGMKSGIINNNGRIKRQQIYLSCVYYVH